jgi:two-component system cell cycle response regulator
MRLRILTVDDSKTVRLIVRKAMKRIGCDTIEAANGVEALAVAASAKPELILLDVTMPVLNGIAVLARLKSDALLSRIPVIMLTARGDRALLAECTRLGVKHYLPKPFKEEALLEQVRAVLSTVSADANSDVKSRLLSGV